MTVFEFFVPGEPKPKGSMRAFMVAGKPVLTSDNASLKDWHACVSGSLFALAGKSMLDGPVRVHLNFYLPKPKKPKHAAHITKPDLDKIVRATLDPLTGVLFKDDSQVTALWTTKEYAGPEGCGARVRVESL